MKKFLQKIYEENKTESPVVMAFGRMNPPTIGHEKLVNRVKEIATDYKAPHHVILSHTTDAKKNPLHSANKLKHAKRFFPDTNIESASKEMPTFLHHAQRLNAAGHDHLVMVAGSDRLDEYERLLHHYNGESDKNPRALFHFKKIEVKSAGHRDPDAEGAEGMSASKMREHAKNNNFNEFKKGVPSHVADKHSKELFDHVRQGMGLHDLTLKNEGLFKAFFVCGGPGSGKDIIIREAFGYNFTEYNTTVMMNILNDKHKLYQKSSDIKLESIQKRQPLIINCNAIEEYKIYEIKEELEELGYDSMMIFVNTTNESSKERNEKLTKVLSESVRRERWETTQKHLAKFEESFENFFEYDNSVNLNEADYILRTEKEEEISLIYEMINIFMEKPIKNAIAETWLIRNNKFDFDLLFERYLNRNKEKNNELIRETKTVLHEKTCTECGTKTNTSFRWLGESSRRKDGEKVRVFDNICPSCQLRAKERKVDDVRDGDIASNTKYTFRTYHEAEEEATPKLQYKPEPKETRFQQDADKQKTKKYKTQTQQAGKYLTTAGVSPEYDTRGQGTVYPMSGLGNVTYREQKENKYTKSFQQFRKEAIDSPSVEMGVTGGYHGPSNKEPMLTQYDKLNSQVSNVKRKKK